jgi:hypothetical protein
VGDNIDIPENWFGNEGLLLTPDPYHGRYAGIYYRLNGIQEGPVGLENTIGNSATDWWREYLEVELTRPLEAGKVYTVSYYVSLAEVSKYGIRLETRLSPNPYVTSTFADCATINDEEGLNSHVGIPTTTGGPGLSHITPSQIVQKNGWHLVTFQVTAAGGERYFTLGNFDENPAVWGPLVQPLPDCFYSYYRPALEYPYLANRIAYYYIDDISVEETIVCECGTKVCFNIDPSQANEPGKCCYAVWINNGHRMNTSEPAPAVCTIHTVVFTDNQTNEELFAWNASSTQGAITGDGLWHNIGSFCVDEFSQFTSKEIRVSLRNPAGEFCSQIEWITGCSNSDPCTCSAFKKTVKLVPDESSSGSCCYKMLIDASKLNGCEIGSVHVYDGITATASAEIIDARETFATPIGSQFAGTLYSFCPPAPFSTASDRKVLVQFKDPANNVICETIVRLTCECQCNSGIESMKSRIVVSFVPVSGATGECCYQLNVTNAGQCRFSLKDIKLEIRDNTPAVTSVSGWSSSVAGTVVSFTRTGSSLEAYGGVSYQIGTLCLPPCVSFDPRTIKITVTTEYGSNDCTVLAKADAFSSCPGEYSCDDFVVTVDSPYSTANIEDCCRVIRARLNGCTAKAAGVRVEVTGPAQERHGVMAIGPGFYEAFLGCRSWSGQVYTVTLRQADGTVLCTKQVTMPSCTLIAPGY